LHIHKAGGNSLVNDRFDLVRVYSDALPSDDQAKELRFRHIELAFTDFRV
jgi:hypothetical protein